MEAWDSKIEGYFQSSGSRSPANGQMQGLPEQRRKGVLVQTAHQGTNHDI